MHFGSLTVVCLPTHPPVVSLGLFIPCSSRDFVEIVHGRRLHHLKANHYLIVKDVMQSQTSSHKANTGKTCARSSKVEATYKKNNNITIVYEMF